MTYLDVLTRLSDGTAHVIAQLWAEVEAGRLSPVDFEVVAADVVNVARTRGALAAQAAFRGYLEASLGLAHPVVTPPPSDASRRLRAAMATILASKLDTAMQLERLARNEPLAAAASAYHEVMATSRVVSGWRRGLDADPCELCVWWARDGRVYTKAHPMPRHKGCACHQIPVIDEKTDNYQTPDQAADTARRARARTKGNKT